MVLCNLRRIVFRRALGTTNCLTYLSPSGVSHSRYTTPLTSWRLLHWALVQLPRGAISSQQGLSVPAFDSTAPIPVLLASVSRLKGKRISGYASTGVSVSTAFNLSKGILSLPWPYERSLLLCVLVERSHYVSKSCNEVSIIRCQTQKALHILSHEGQVFTASIFTGPGATPVAFTMWLRYFTSFWNRAHFLGFSFKFALFNRWNVVRRLAMCWSNV